VVPLAIDTVPCLLEPCLTDYYLISVLLGLQ